MSEKKDVKPEEGKRAPAIPEETVSTTHHTVMIDGEVIAYTVTAGTLLLQEESDEKGVQPKASVFYVAYTRDDVVAVSDRPITFSFNGGPGSSSVWMHLGVLGPRRVQLAEDGGPVPPPYKLVNNEYSLLDKTDLVFIDPVSTGYSRPVPGEEARQFHSLETDIESVGEFIRLYTTRNMRWTSPKFLIGESYGTTRAAGLSGFLQQRHGIYLNGIMLISTILNFQSARFDTGNDLPYVLFLPTYAATAWYHQRLPGDLQAQPLQEVLAEVEQFARAEYTLALMRGARLPKDERAAIVRFLARYTGLSESYIERTNLRVEILRFVKELLRDDHRTVGRLDTRFTGIDRDAAGERFEFDPSYAIIQGPYTATFNDYVRRDLGFESDVPYEILTNLYTRWDYSKHQNQYVNVAETLRSALCQNPFLKVFVANGYYDLATPYFATDYTFNHLDLDPSLHDNISMVFYEAGHMMYVHLPSLAKLKADLAAFINAAVPA
ncbi:MAG: peptidase S10 [Anaerolineae bacterium]|nr:peptidase S10 [Anaerolineae bacterium]